MNRPARAEVTGRKGLSGGGRPPALPKLFATVAEAAVILGLSRTGIYRLAHDHPDVLIRFNGRSLIDLEPAAAIVRAGPRGPRKPPKPGRKGRKGGRAKEWAAAGPAPKG